MTKQRIKLWLGLMMFLSIPLFGIFCITYDNGALTYVSGELVSCYASLLTVIAAFFDTEQSADKKPISGDGADKKPFGDWADKKPIVWGCEDVRK